MPGTQATASLKRLDSPGEVQACEGSTTSRYPVPRQPIQPGLGRAAVVQPSGVAFEAWSLNRPCHPVFCLGSWTLQIEGLDVRGKCVAQR